MKICPNCGRQYDDGVEFCNVCGGRLTFGAQPNYNQAQPEGGYAQYQSQPYADPTDHTAEFDAKDISDNKVIAMCVYLLGVVGIIIALLAANNSKYVAFHLRQAIKFVVVEALMGLAAVLLCWTFIVPIAVAIMSIVLFVVKIICFVQICQGKAKEPAVIKNFNFLK